MLGLLQKGERRKKKPEKINSGLLHSAKGRIEKKKKDADKNEEETENVEEEEEEEVESLSDTMEEDVEEGIE